MYLFFLEHMRDAHELERVERKKNICEESPILPLILMIVCSFSYIFD